MTMAGSVRRYGFDVTEFGATGDGETLDTDAIQAAIQACTEAGGGVVLVPPGRYLSGPISLFDNVDLHLEPGAVLLGSRRLEDYTIEKRKVSGESARAGLVTARDARNVSITGRGAIDGSAMAFVRPDELHYAGGQDFDRSATRQGENYLDPRFGAEHDPFAHGGRPGNMVRFIDCENVLIRGVTIQNSPTWTVQIRDCVGIVITGVAINSEASGCRVPNDDGINLVQSRRARISDCDIQTGDDAIAMSRCEQVVVTNCTLSSRSSAVRVGTTGSGLRDCVFSNLVIHATNRGLGVFIRGSGSVENILFSDIVVKTRLFTGHWWGNGEPIHVSAVPSDLTGDQGPVGTIRNVRFRNVVAEGEHGILVHGCEESAIRDISFENVRLLVRNSPLHERFGGNLDLRDTTDRSRALFEHDVPAVYCRHVDGLSIRDLTVEWEDGLPEFFTHALHCEDFCSVVVGGFRGRQAHVRSDDAVIRLDRGSGVTVRNCAAGKGTGTFLALSGVTDERLFSGNDLGHASRARTGEERETVDAKV